MFGRKEDLVERVMESIKTLSKKEEEIKGSSTTATHTQLNKLNNKKGTNGGGGEILNYKNNVASQ
jgi:hypothetical protein